MHTNPNRTSPFSRKSNRCHLKWKKLQYRIHSHHQWRLYLNSHHSAAGTHIYIHIYIHLHGSTLTFNTETHNKMADMFPLLNRPQSQVSDEIFFLFHSIDRELYTRLVNMGRDPGESIQVMAFLMWLEREAVDMSFIKRLLPLPHALINDLADEALICLKCVENDRFEFGDEISLLPEFFNSPNVNLRFFHENRIKVVRGVTKIINTVCIRAFNDIMQRAWNENAAAFPQALMGYAPAAGSGGGFNAAAPRPGPWPMRQFIGSSHEVGESSREAERRNEGRVGGAPPPPPPPPPHVYYRGFRPPYVPRPQPPPGFPTRVHHHHPRPPPPPAPAPVEAMLFPIHFLPEEVFPAYDFGAQRDILNNELGEILSRNLVINPNDENPSYNEEEIPADDRTIFLTFSKGYPIKEDEVREFFTRRFEDCIEDLIMQEVGKDEQALYARMVVRPPDVVNRIVGPNKAKYSINGKHVWARKYMKKQNNNNNQQLRISASASDSASASASQPAASAS